MNIPDNSRAVEVRESQGAQVGSHNTQNITYNYTTPADRAANYATSGDGAVRPAGVVVGEVPQRAPAFQSRPGLTDLLEASGPGVAVVRPHIPPRRARGVQLPGDRWHCPTPSMPTRSLPAA